MFMKFPKNFMWGSGVSALQTEGAGTTPKAPSVWKTLYEKEPGAFYGQASPDQGVDAMRHYKEDLANMAAYGHNSFRAGFSWCRLFPDGKKANKEAVAYYHDFLKEARKLNLKIVMTVHHFELPQYIADIGGYASEKYPLIFKNFCKFIFEEYSNEVDIFALYNEPNAEILFGYMNSYMPPKLNSIEKGVAAWKGVVLSSGMVCEMFDKDFRSKKKAKLAAIHAIWLGVAKDGKNFSEKDAQAVTDWDGLMNYSVLDAMLLGKVSPEFAKTLENNGHKLTLTEKERQIIAKNHYDYAGMNYYSIQRMQAPQKPSGEKSIVSKVTSPYFLENPRLNPYRGWEIYPEGLSLVADVMKNRYKNLPYWIAENGMAVQEEWRWMDKDGIVQDDYRIAFVSEHLAQLHKDIENGANCVGYHLWSSYDCWSMMNGHKNTYGFFRVDTQTMKRFPKKSAYWFREIGSKNGLDSSFKRVDEVIDLKVKAIPSGLSSEGILKGSNKTKK